MPQIVLDGSNLIDNRVKVHAAGKETALPFYLRNIFIGKN